MKVIRQEHDYGTSYILSEGDTSLKITLGGNGDIVWQLVNTKSLIEKVSPYEDVYETMYITPENYTIYQVFDELMSDVESGEIIKAKEVVPDPTFGDEFYAADVYQLDPFSVDEEDEIALTENYKQEVANKKNAEIVDGYHYKKIYQNKSIIWRSDADIYKLADMLKISRIDDGFLLEFTRPNQEPSITSSLTPGTINIYFSQYNIMFPLFKRMFNKLNEYEPSYHQIHLAELEYQKNITLRKKNS